MGKSLMLNVIIWDAAQLHRHVKAEPPHSVVANVVPVRAVHSAIDLIWCCREIACPHTMHGHRAGALPTAADALPMSPGALPIGAH